MNLLYALKQGVMGQDPDAPAVLEGSEPNGVTRIEAAVAYLAYVIRYVRGWLICNRSDLFRGRRPNWFVNLGLPAASYDNETLVQSYREAAAGALMLANSGEAVSMEAIRTFLRDEIVKDAAQSRKSAEALGIAVIPEVAAAATAFAKSTGAASGLYLLVDVGATTLDACTFWLARGLGKDGGDGYSLFNADVRPLGVEAFHCFQAQGRTEEEFREQCDYCLHKVVWDTKRCRCPTAGCWNEGDALPVFFTGGGSRNDLHRRIVEGLRPWLAEYAQNDGIRLIDIPKPDSIDLPEPLNDLSRLAVAWGLSYPPTEIGEITPMSDIDDVPPPPRRDTSARFVPKEQM